MDISLDKTVDKYLLMLKPSIPLDIVYDKNVLDILEVKLNTIYRPGARIEIIIYKIRGQRRMKIKILNELILNKND